MNKQTRTAAIRAWATTRLKTAGFGFAALAGLVLLIPLGLWFAARRLAVRRNRAVNKKTFAASTSF